MARWLSWLERRPVTAKVVGSSPIRVVLYGVLAQLGEHLPYKQGVIGSSPIRPITFLGGIPEWPKGTDCKSAGTAFGGSNPPSPTNPEAEKLRDFRIFGCKTVDFDAKKFGKFWARFA